MRRDNINETQKIRRVLKYLIIDLYLESTKSTNAVKKIGLSSEIWISM
jgi:hypothetical protein